jgi:hypothetical protein
MRLRCGLKLANPALDERHVVACQQIALPVNRSSYHTIHSLGTHGRLSRATTAGYQANRSNTFSCYRGNMLLQNTDLITSNSVATVCTDLLYE